MQSSNLKSPPTKKSRAAELLARRVRAFSAEIASRTAAVESFAPLEATHGDDASAVRVVLRELREEHEELLTADEELRAQSEELRHAIARSEEERQRYQELFEASSDALLVTDPFGVVQGLNAAAAAMFTLERRRVRGKPLSVLFGGDDTKRWFKALRDLKAGRRRVTIALSVKRHGSSAVPVSASCTAVEGGARVLVSARRADPPLPAVDADDRIAALERALRDNQDLLARERDARRRLEIQSKATARFVGLLRHDLRGPLNAVLGWADLLGREPLAKAARERALSVISRNARMQLGLVDQLLDVFRMTGDKLPFEVRPFDVGAAVQRACSTFARASRDAGVTLSVDTTLEAGATLFGDAARIEQVMTILLSNALTFTPRGGNVRVAVARHGDFVVIRVADDGRGVDSRHVDTLFSFGHARRAAPDGGGLGLGLYVAKQLVELHGGSIVAESEGLDRGATFTVRLPATSSGDEADGPRATAPADRVEGVRVLVVDDDVDTRELLASVLGERGASVAVARDAAQAFELVGSFRPDVLVSDVALPGEDGLSLLRRVREIAPELSAIALSGFATASDVARAHEAGFDVHLAKPLALGKLLDAIADLTRAS